MQLGEVDMAECFWDLHSLAFRELLHFARPQVERCDREDGVEEIWVVKGSIHRMPDVEFFQMWRLRGRKCRADRGLEAVNKV